MTRPCSSGWLPATRGHSSRVVSLCSAGWSKTKELRSSCRTRFSLARYTSRCPSLSQSRKQAPCAVASSIDSVTESLQVIRYPRPASSAMSRNCGRGDPSSPPAPCAGAATPRAAKVAADPSRDNFPGLATPRDWSATDATRPEGFLETEAARGLVVAAVFACNGTGFRGSLREVHFELRHTHLLGDRPHDRTFPMIQCRVPSPICRTAWHLRSRRGSRSRNDWNQGQPTDPTVASDGTRWLRSRGRRSTPLQANRSRTPACGAVLD